MAAEWINVTTLPGFSFAVDFGSVSQAGSNFEATWFSDGSPPGSSGAQVTFSATGTPAGKVLTGAARVNVTSATDIVYSLIAGAGVATDSSVSGPPLTVVGTCSATPPLTDFASAYVGEEYPNAFVTEIIFNYEVEIDDEPEFWTDIIGCREEA